MPGIVGFIPAAGVELHRPVLDAMLGCMLHESHYTSGTLIEKEFGLEVGWVCHNKSFSDCLPIWNETRDVCLVFSGEEFTEPAEIGRLKAAGHSFKEANASYLAHLYEDRGPRFFETLNGAFSGLLIDLRENKVVLFNDRFGLGRIYFHENQDGFYFASEAKALLKVLPQLRCLEMPELGELLTLGCVLQNRTIFGGISLVPAGSTWTFRPSQPVRKEAYFSTETWESQEKLSPDDYYKSLKGTFARILPRYFGSSEPIAMSLTGGLDGRIIMAWAGCEPGSL